MRQINFEPTIGNIQTSLLGGKLSVIGNDDFCQSVKKEDDGTGFDPYGYGNKGTTLIYVVPSSNEQDEDQNSSSNVVINLLMQLKAFQSEQNTIFRDTNLLKQQIVKQLNFETINLSSYELKNQIKKITQDSQNHLLKEDEINKAVNLVRKGLKKNI